MPQTHALYQAFSSLRAVLNGLLLSTAVLAQGAESDKPPQLSGWWAYTASTPWQRAPELGDQRSYSLAEMADLEDRAWSNGGTDGLNRRFGYQALQIAQVHGEYRTSLIVAPPDGRVPYLPEIISRQQEAVQLGKPFSGPEALPVEQRCLAAQTQLPLLAPQAGDDLALRSMLIKQLDDYLLIHYPGSNVLRIIKLQGSPIPYAEGQWLGDSLAAYDGDSLVVNTSGFRIEQSNRHLKSSERLQIYERFSLMETGRLLYTYTVFDPEVLAQPFTVEMPLERLPVDTQFRQTACHEGNSSLPAALISARLQETMN